MWLPLILAFLGITKSDLFPMFTSRSMILSAGVTMACALATALALAADVMYMRVFVVRGPRSDGVLIECNVCVCVCVCVCVWL